MHASIDFKLYTLNVLIYSNDLDRSTFSSPASLNDMLMYDAYVKPVFFMTAYHANKSKSTRGMRKKKPILLLHARLYHTHPPRYMSI